ncbi:hypothetical protein ACFQY0_11350 [Haloferula chungangensis]|uniref:Uncharacterized protein n=1 Tax=Haloferula chungangensis TaxID=1048331 RepID=A0ABW2L9J2_9BACT
MPFATSMLFENSPTDHGITDDGSPLPIAPPMEEYAEAIVPQPFKPLRLTARIPSVPQIISRIGLFDGIFEEFLFLSDGRLHQECR